VKVSRPLRIVLAALVALVLALAAAESAGWPFLKQPLQRWLSGAAAVPVQFDGRFRAHLLWHPHLDVEHLVIGAAKGFAVPHLLDARQARLGWRWSDVWHWRHGAPLRVDSLVVDALDARLVRDADGRASWQLGAPHTQRAAGTPLALPQFGRLNLKRGSVQVDDAISATRLQIEIGNTTAEHTQLSARGTYRKLVAHGHIDADGPLPLLGGDDPKARVHVTAQADIGNARIEFDGRAASLLGDRLLDGKLFVRGSSLAAVGAPFHVTLPNTAPFELRGQLTHGVALWALRADSASIGKSQLAGQFVYDPRPTPPLLLGSLTGPRLALADLGPAVGKPVAKPAASAAAAPGHVIPDKRFDLPSLRAMDADVDVAIDVLDFGSQALQPMEQLRTQVHLAAGVLSLNALQARVAGGLLTGSSRLDGTGNPAKWWADLRVKGLDIDQWLRRLHPRDDKKGNVQAYLTGSLDGATQVTGEGRSTAEILGTLDGKAQLALRDGTLSHLVTEAAGLDLAQALGVMIKGDDALPLRCAYTDLALDNGVATLHNAVIDNKDSTIRITGRASLRDESLALVATVYPKDFSIFSLRSPVLVQGTFAQPAVHLKASGIGARVLAAAGLSALLPPAALLAFVDVGKQAKGDACAQAPR